MTLHFARECLIIDGFPILGTVEVEAELQDGLPYFYTMAFEPETPVPGLLWSDVGPACEGWLRENWARVQASAFKRS